MNKTTNKTILIFDLLEANKAVSKTRLQITKLRDDLQKLERQMNKVQCEVSESGLRVGDKFNINGVNYELIHVPNDGLFLVEFDFINLDSGVSNHDAGTNNTNDV